MYLWCEPKDNLTDYYLCLVNTKGYEKEKRQNISFCCTACACKWEQPAYAACAIHFKRMTFPPLTRWIFAIAYSKHKCRSREIFEDAKDFCTNFPKLSKRLSCNLYRPFFGVDPKKWSSLVFLQTLGAIFWSQTTLGAIFAQIFSDFAQIFRDFARISTNQNFWGCACIPVSYTTDSKPRQATWNEMCEMRILEPLKYLQIWRKCRSTAGKCFIFLQAILLTFRPVLCQLPLRLLEAFLGFVFLERFQQSPPKLRITKLPYLGSVLEPALTWPSWQSLRKARTTSPLKATTTICNPPTRCCLNSWIIVSGCLFWWIFRFRFFETKLNVDAFTKHPLTLL